MRRPGQSEGTRPQARLPIDLPGSEAGPLRRIGFRLAIALAPIMLVAVVTYLGREGYQS
jgi:hypothetical protein